MLDEAACGGERASRPQARKAPQPSALRCGCYWRGQWRADFAKIPPVACQAQAWTHGQEHRGAEISSCPTCRPSDSWLRVKPVAHSAAANARCTHPEACCTPRLGGFCSDAAASASCTVGLASLPSAALLLVLLSLGVPHRAWERRNTPPALRCPPAGSTAVCRQQGAWIRGTAFS